MKAHVVKCTRITQRTTLWVYFLIMKYLLLIIVTFIMICIYFTTQSKEYSTTITVDSCEYIVTHSKDCKFCKMRQ